MDVYRQIADKAAFIAQAFPEDAAKFRADDRELNELRNLLPNLDRSAVQHSRKCWENICDELRGEVGNLASLVFLHLSNVAPSVPLIVRVVPHWHRDPAFDWVELVRQLRVVEAAAIQKLTPTPVQVDAVTVACDAWLIAQWEKGTLISKLLNSTRVKKLQIETEGGLRHRVTAAYRRAGKVKPPRPQRRRA